MRFLKNSCLRGWEPRLREVIKYKFMVFVGRAPCPTKLVHFGSNDK